MRSLQAELPPEINGVLVATDTGPVAVTRCGLDAEVAQDVVEWLAETLQPTGGSS